MSNEAAGLFMHKCMLAESSSQNRKEIEKIRSGRRKYRVRRIDAFLSRKGSLIVSSCKSKVGHAYKAATRATMAKIPAPVAERAEAALSKGATPVVVVVGAPVPDGLGTTAGVVPLADG